MAARQEDSETMLFPSKQNWAAWLKKNHRKSGWIMAADYREEGLWIGVGVL